MTPTDVINGDTMVVTGTGCVSPATGSVEGLVAGVLLTSPEGSSVSTRYLGASETTPVDPDGSFTAQLTVSDGVPPGTAHMIVQCGKRAMATSTQVPDVLAVDVETTAPPVPITVRTPHVVEVAPTTLAAGGMFEVHAECPQRTNPEYQTLQLHVVPPIAASQYFPGIHVSEGRADGSVQVPPAAAPGTYVVTPACTIHRTLGAMRYYEPITLTITP